MRFIILIFLSHFAGASVPDTSCNGVLLLSNPVSMSSALEELKFAIDAVPASVSVRERSWYHLLADYARASEGENNLVVVSMVGGGNAGKSTLFNSLSSLLTGSLGLHLEQPLSLVGFYPGLTRRMVIATGTDAPPWVTTELRRRFGNLEPWSNARSSVEPGPGLLATRSEILPEMAFVDSPDFDTGAANTFEPDNLSRALKVILPSDVLMILVDSHTVRNQANVKILNSAFKLYGRKKLILVYQADPAVPTQEIRSMLERMAQSLYGVETEGFPEGVLGAYVMPYSSEVAAGRRLSELKPLNGFLEFSSLATQMNTQARLIKRYSQASAISMITQGVEEFLRGHYKRAYAIRIYQQAVEVAARVAGQQSIGDFRYLEVRDVMRTKFRAFDGQLRNLIYQFGNVTAIPDRLILNLVQHFRPGAILAKRLAADHKSHDRLAVTQMLSILQSERMPLSKDPDAATKALRDATVEFYAMFPEEAVTDNEGQIALPSVRLLPESVRREYQNLLNLDSEVLIERLEKLIDSIQFDPQESLSRHDLNHVMGKIRQQEKLWRTSAVTALDIATLAAPAGAGYWLANHGINNTFIWVAVIIGSSRPMRWWSDHLVDSYLQREINAWYHRLQLDSTKTFFTDAVAGNLRAALAREIASYDGPEFNRLGHALSDVKDQLNTFYSAP